MPEEELVDIGDGTDRIIDPEGIDHFYVLMQDTEGNEFCVV